MKMDYIIKGVFAFTASAATYLFGGWNGLLQALVCIIILDYITGVLRAYTTKTLSSAVGAKGIIKKFMYLAIVALAHIMDKVFGNANILRDAAIYVFIANEGLSIIENAAILDVPFVRPLKDKLEQLKDKNNDKDNKS